MQNLRRIGLFAALLFLTTTALAKPFTYVNARFGTVCTFPDQIFTERMPEPENGDGLEWHSADGASVACYGSYNALDDTPKSLVENEKASPEPGEEVTYGKAGKNWAVLSGMKGDKIFYRRSVFGRKDVIHSVFIEYPAALKAKYDPLVGTIAGSLHEASGPHWK
ncbi:MULTISPECIES: hypothetical protein [unclassified Mesorhizobium]|uniref:hypothetical protein n=1 Tax=unclassified Mesorhizobium TaxID=325217 RepID=UPI000F74E20A|nr:MULTISPECIES: hypothetical protein [unclassified Mesorhizobium]AZO07154.1 hypothetical protein EJ068_31900 [Mesorhizobium sp. M2A.F.Ca.ET.043.02.1.1]RUW41257.1 hypothetical protein EOA37_11150 [Mesorhizobium sp. M2A.F.Ca.ET.015.02.1.1]RVC93129.1 hypothetical protein EN753_34090 [Mesorhizobium sp. M2A.F.Ca.ET.029.05.1.1]RVC93183.1 hypothetical protein EN739_22405 [Mesorhizobium sp. M2A.F.Ca.ET.017.03.2.1]RWB47440.1 MAG: hypothetical protein EOQ46_05160 [Mesorhizobium sp.]